ncbi:MAG: gliding motility lipoprotein GldH [Cyclobacteriaceae bacterium]
MKYNFFFLFTLLFLAGCDSNRVFENYKEFEDRAWRVNDPAVFEFQIKDVSKKYNLYYNVRNSLEYPYARIFVQYSLADSIGTELTKKLASNFLFDQKTGRPLGRSGLGDVLDNQFLLLSNQSFKTEGTYRFRLDQFNRQDTLKGVLAIGLRVEAASRQ